MSRRPAGQPGRSIRHDRFDRAEPRHRERSDVTQGSATLVAVALPWIASLHAH